MSYYARLIRAGVLLVTLSALFFRADCAFITDSCRVGHVFSYFTVLSNILFAFVLALSLLHRGQEREWLTSARALAVTYLIVSGVTFGTMLSNADLVGHVFHVPLSSKVMHFVLPVYAVLDFVFVPGRHRLHWRTAWISLGFPLIWSVYALLRGSVSGWYPYFFLDPQQVGGYRAVAVYSSVVAALILLSSFTVVALNRLSARRGSRFGLRVESSP